MNPLRAWREWRHGRILERHPIPDACWSGAVARSHAVAHLTDDELLRLRGLATLFLREKSIEAAGGLQLTDAMRARIACECCVPILNLGLELYRGWYSVVVYPGEFVARHRYTDEAGVEHDEHDARLGEAWTHGPVIVSWDDIEHAEPGYNVIIHEMAHKLDLLDGGVNGRPPLHADMDPREWTRVFSRAYREQVRRAEAGRDTVVDPYGAEDPGEFFAVVSEEFFDWPETLAEHWPEVFEQLVLYYRQRPTRRSRHTRGTSA